MPTGTLIALLRGINVGRAKRVAMADLRALIEELGYQDVRTLLNSGNVVFTAPRGIKGDPGTRIEEALAARLGVTSRVTILTAAELAEAVATNPLADVAHDPSRFLIAVPSGAAERKKLEALTEQEWAPEALALGRRVAYLWCPNGVLDSALNVAVSRLLRDSVTARNWATTLKLHTLAKSTA